MEPGLRPQYGLVMLTTAVIVLAIGRVNALIMIVICLALFGHRQIPLWREFLRQRRSNRDRLNWVVDELERALEYLAPFTQSHPKGGS